MHNYCSTPAALGVVSVGPNIPIDTRSVSSPAANGSAPSGSKFPDRVKAFFRNHNYTLDSQEDSEEYAFVNRKNFWQSAKLSSFSVLKFRFQLRYIDAPWSAADGVKKYGLHHFVVHKVLGKGSFGKVIIYTIVSFIEYTKILEYINHKIFEKSCIFYICWRKSSTRELVGEN